MPKRLLKKQLIRPKWDWEQITKTFMKNTEFEFPPVGITLIPNAGDNPHQLIPEDVPIIEKPRITVCEIIQEARIPAGYTGDYPYEKKLKVNSFAIKDPMAIRCSAGRANIGMADLHDAYKTGLRDYLLRKFSTIQAARRMREMIPRLEPESIFAILAFPLSDAPVDPAVVVTIGSPNEISKTITPYAFKTGGRIHAETIGVCAACSDLTAVPLIHNKPNLSLMCPGAKLFGKYPNEIGISYPGGVFSDIANALEVFGKVPKWSNFKIA